MSRLVELFEGDNGKLSMRSLITYIAVTTLCVGILGAIFLKDSTGAAIGLAGILSTLVGLVYSVGKAVDGSVQKSLNSQPDKASAPGTIQ